MERTRPAVLGGAALAGIAILIVAVFGNATVWAQSPATTTASAAPAVVAAPSVDVEASPEASNVRLLVGKSTLIDVGTPIARVSLTSADIADALVTAPSQLLVHGKVPGSISMFVWSRGGAVRRYEIAVQRDLAKLSEQLKQLFPNERIEVSSNGRNVILSGTVSNKDVAERALNVTASFVEKKEDVVTTLQVAQSRPSNQVLLRVRFAEVSRTALTEFGMAFFTSPTGIKNTVGRVTTQQYAAPNFSDMAWTKANSDFGGDVLSAEGKFSFSDFLNLFLLSEKYDLGTVIRAMQQRGLFQSLAEPNLVAESGKEASFLAGGEFPVPIAQGSGSNLAVSITFKEFGIRLNFTPTVNGDRVHLKVRPEVSTLDYGNSIVLSGFRIPALSTRRTETELELRDGQTFAIAGLMNNRMQSTLQKVPGIGDIPILGHLFRSRAAQKDQTELVVMITPEILPTNSEGVTRDLPRLGEPFLAPIPQNRSLPAPPPPFRQGGGSGAMNAPQAPPTSTPSADEIAELVRQREAEQAQQRTARQNEDADLKQMARDERTRLEADRKAAKLAEEEARRQKKEQERQDKIAAEQAKADLKAAERAQEEAARRAEISRKEQEKAAREQAKRDAAEAKRQQEIAERAAKAQKSSTNRDEERERAIAAAEARLKAAEAAYQAQVGK